MAVFNSAKLGKTSLHLRCSSRVPQSSRAAPWSPRHSFSQRRSFSSTPTHRSKSRIYTPIRSQDELSNLLLLSSSSRIPLLTLWTASWCPSYKVVSPLLQEVLEERKEGSPVGFAEVEMDAPDLGDLGMRYMITSVPTLLAFSRGEAQMETRVSAVRDLKDRELLQGWIDIEASRGGAGGAGGGGGIFGGLFGR